MKIAFFNTKTYDRGFFDRANENRRHEITYFEPRLTKDTASLADGHQAVCAFVNDELDASCLLRLSKLQVNTIALRCAGFNQVELSAANDLSMRIVRVPAYSPQAVAEHTLGLLLCLQRKLHRAFPRVRDGNFSLEGLLGKEIAGRRIGVIGTGSIGSIVAKLLCAFGADVVAHDKQVNEQCQAAGVRYVGLDELIGESDVITLHCPLLPATRHLINAESIGRMRRGVTLINTSRGGLIDTPALIEGLKSGRIGAVGIDVYEEEENLFFEDLSGSIIQDDQFARLLTFPNAVVTGHQAFFTEKAMSNIAEVTLSNLDDLEESGSCVNEIQPADPQAGI